MAAAALIPPLAWEFPCATPAALKRKKKKKKEWINNKVLLQAQGNLFNLLGQNIMGNDILFKKNVYIYI